MDKSASQFTSTWLDDLHNDWQPLLKNAQRVHLRKNALLFTEGQACHRCYIVESGRIRLVVHDRSGRELHLAIVGRNGLVGDIGAEGFGVHVTSAIASTDANVYALSRSVMVEAMQKEPRILHQVLAMADLRFKLMVQHRVLMGVHHARAGICLHLLGLMHSYGRPHLKGFLLDIVFSQQEMADLCGISRVSVSHVFSALEKGGLIGREGRHIVIIDPAGLQAELK